MSTIENRRKAREEYLLSLQKQKTSEEELKEIIPSNAVQNITAGNRREQLLEEKRKAFFEGKGHPCSKLEVDNIAGGRKVDRQSAVDVDTTSLAKPENKTVLVQPEYKLSDWKNIGFPSEYAYAKHLGLLNEPLKPKPLSLDVTKESKIINTTSNQPFHAHNTENFQSKEVLSNGSASNAVQPQYAGSTRIRNHDADVLNSGKNDDLFRKVNRLSTVNENYISSDLGQDEFTETKKMQEMKFTEALKSDQTGNMNSASNETGSQKDFAIGNIPSSRTNIRTKQMEYAALLQRDQALYNTKFDYPSHRSKEESDGNEGLKLQVVGGSSTDVKRQKQIEYVNLLQNDQQILPPADLKASDQFRSNPAQQDGENSSLQIDFRIGNVPSRTDIRTKQIEYAALLQKDQRSLQSKQSDKPIQQPTNGLNGFGADPLLGGQMINRDEKRKKQMEYANLLQKDQQNLQHNSIVYNSGLETRVGSELYSNERVKKQEEYAHQLHQDQIQQSYQDQIAQDLKFRDLKSNVRSQSLKNNVNVDVDERDMKKQKQKDYAKALLLQMEMKNQTNQQNSRQKQQDINVFGYRGNENLPQQFHPSIHYQDTSQPFPHYSVPHQHPPLVPSHRDVSNNYLSGNDSELSSGYVMGPLGIPVRQTLEVGNRKLQKAFNDHFQHQLSPPKLRSSENLHSPPQNRLYDPLVPSCNFADNLSDLAEEKGLVSGFGQDEEEKKKQLKLKQQMALTEQIRANKERMELEKAKNDELERKEQQKVEKELREMKEAFEKEQQKQKLKSIDERNVQQELENQRELKKRERMEEERGLREAERIEEERISKGRKELIRREEEDKRRELLEKNNHPDFEQGNHIFFLFSVFVSCPSLSSDHAS
jgi:hypothetical protein